MHTPLKSYRKENRLTLADVAERVGITESHLSRVERAGTNMLPLAMRLAEVTGLPVQSFVRDANEPAESAA